MAQKFVTMNPSVSTLPRFLAARLLWYAGVAALAVMALVSQTQFSATAVLSAIAIYIPLSMLALPLVAWLALRRATGPAPVKAAPAWPCWLAAAVGMALLAGYHLWAWLELAEGGVLLLLVAVDIALARRESARLIAYAAAHRATRPGLPGSSRQ